MTFWELYVTRKTYESKVKTGGIVLHLPNNEPLSIGNLCPSDRWFIIQEDVDTGKTRILLEKRLWDTISHDYTLNPKNLQIPSTLCKTS